MDVDLADRGYFYYPGAFDHNRMFKMSTTGSRLTGCHDLPSLLNAQARGVVLAAVTKSPGEGLPEGVWLTMLACREDVHPPDLPDSTKQQAVAPCPSPTGAIRFKNKAKLITKTVYDPCRWPDRELAKCCLEAFNAAADNNGNNGAYLHQNGSSYVWEGKFVSGGEEFWIRGYSQGGNSCNTSKITNFHFVHEDDLQLI